MSKFEVREFEIQYIIIGEKGVRTLSYHANNKKEAYKQFWEEIGKTWKKIELISTPISKEQIDFERFF